MEQGASERGGEARRDIQGFVWKGEAKREESEWGKAGLGKG